MVVRSLFWSDRSGFGSFRGSSSAQFDPRGVLGNELIDTLLLADEQLPPRTQQTTG
jgi:hypothetical protein